MNALPRLALMGALIVLSGCSLLKVQLPQLRGSAAPEASEGASDGANASAESASSARSTSNPDGAAQAAEVSYRELPSEELALMGVKMLLGELHQVSGQDAKGQPVVAPAVPLAQLNGFEVGLTRVGIEGSAQLLKTEARDTTLQIAVCQMDLRAKGKPVPDEVSCPNFKAHKADARKLDESPAAMSTFFETFLVFAPEAERELLRKRFARTVGWKSEWVQVGDKAFGGSYPGAIIRTPRPISEWSRPELRLAQHFASGDAALLAELKTAFEKAPTVACTRMRGVIRQEALGGDRFGKPKYFAAIGGDFEEVPCKGAKGPGKTAPRELQKLALEAFKHKVVSLTLLEDDTWGYERSPLGQVTARHHPVVAITQREL